MAATTRYQCFLHAVIRQPSPLHASMNPTCVCGVCGNAAKIHADATRTKIRLPPSIRAVYAAFAAMRRRRHATHDCSIRRPRAAHAAACRPRSSRCRSMPPFTMPPPRRAAERRCCTQGTEEGACFFRGATMPLEAETYMHRDIRHRRRWSITCTPSLPTQAWVRLPERHRT